MKNNLKNLLFYIIPTPFGGLFFRLTKKKFNNDYNSRSGYAWWYGYLYYYACNYDVEKLKKDNKGKIAVKTILPDFDWFTSYNTVFHYDCISHILFEMARGYIPIIDDKWHVWNQFFEQPININGEETDVNNIQVSDEKNTHYTPTLIHENRKIRSVWAKLIRDFTRLKENEREYIDNESKEVLSKGNRVLAVVLRGTDYKTANMAKQPEFDDLIKDVKEWMSKYDYDKVYLATEEERIYNLFEEALPGLILVNRRTYYDKAMVEQNVKWIGEVTFNRENDDYLKGLEYLSSIYILSRCKALLAGSCGASNMALILNDNQYERFRIY